MEITVRGGYMGIKYRTTVNKLPEVSSALETLGGRKVTIGALKVLTLGWQEYMNMAVIFL